jgi:hypothetical protein
LLNLTKEPSVRTFEIKHVFIGILDATRFQRFGGCFSMLLRAGVIYSQEAHSCKELASSPRVRANRFHSGHAEYPE